MNEIPYLFIYPGLFREFRVAAYKKIINSDHDSWADIVLIPAMTPIEIGSNYKVGFLSSDTFPSLTRSLATLPYMGKNTKPSISKYEIDTFKPEELPAVIKYLQKRGWKLKPGICPATPFEIADIERVAYYGQPMWIEHVEEQKELAAEKKCEGPTFLF